MRGKIIKRLVPAFRIIHPGCLCPLDRLAVSDSVFEDSLLVPEAVGGAIIPDIGFAHNPVLFTFYCPVVVVSDALLYIGVAKDHPGIDNLLDLL